METAPVPDQIRYAYTVQMTDASTPVPQHPFPFQNIDPEAIPHLAASEMIQSDMPQVQQRAWRMLRGKRDSIRRPLLSIRQLAGLSLLAAKLFIMMRCPF